jgi:hypothetical protein
MGALRPGSLQALFHIRSSEFNRLESSFLPLAIALGSVFVLALVARALRNPRWILAAFLVFPTALLTVSFHGLTAYAEAASSRPLVAAMGEIPSGSVVACVESFPTGLPYYLDRPVTLITRDGHELTSNYVTYTLRKAAEWPSVMVPWSGRLNWLQEQSGPTYLLSRRKSTPLLDSLATARGVAAREIRPGWWGVLLPPAEDR